MTTATNNTLTSTATVDVDAEIASCRAQVKKYQTIVDALPKNAPASRRLAALNEVSNAVECLGYYLGFESSAEYRRLRRRLNRQFDAVELHWHIA